MPASKTEQWIDWALRKVERLPGGIGDRAAAYRQDRSRNNPEPVAEYDKWMEGAVTENNRPDRINGYALSPLPPLPLPPRDFENMMSTTLEQSGLGAADQLVALSMINEATIDLRQARPPWPGRTASVASVSAEWHNLGVTEAQAHQIVSEAISCIQAQTQTQRDIRNLEGMPDEREGAYHDNGDEDANVAGRAPLSWQLEDEDPRDNLDDVRHGAMRKVGLAVEKPAQADPVELFLATLTEGRLGKALSSVRLHRPATIPGMI